MTLMHIKSIIWELDLSDNQEKSLSSLDDTEGIRIF